MILKLLFRYNKKFHMSIIELLYQCIVYFSFKSKINRRVELNTINYNKSFDSFNYEYVEKYQRGDNIDFNSMIDNGLTI